MKKIASILFIIIGIIFIYLSIIGREFFFLILGIGFLFPFIEICVYKLIHRNDPKPEKKFYSYLVNKNISNNIIVDIEQVKQNLNIEYEIKENGDLIFKGYDNFVEKHLPAKMEDSNGNLVFKYIQDIKELAKAQIPESGHNERNGFIKNQSNDVLGKIYHVGFGGNRYYCINYNNDELEIYMWSTGRSPHLSVFLNCQQIAQIEHENMVNNYLDKYTLYLLSDYEKYKEILCFFTMIYDKYENGNHGKMFYGEKINSSFNYSIEGIGKDKYFEEFMKYNFPNVIIVNEKLSNVINTIKDRFEITKKQVLTKKNYNETVKIGILFCTIVILLISTFLLFIDLYFGIIVLVSSAISEILFFWIMKKICKY